MEGMSIGLTIDLIIGSYIAIGMMTAIELMVRGNKNVFKLGLAVLIGPALVLIDK